MDINIRAKFSKFLKTCTIIKGIKFSLYHLKISRFAFFNSNFPPKCIFQLEIFLILFLGSHVILPFEFIYYSFNLDPKLWPIQSLTISHSGSLQLFSIPFPTTLRSITCLESYVELHQKDIPSHVVELKLKDSVKFQENSYFKETNEKTLFGYKIYVRIK